MKLMEKKEWKWQEEKKNAFNKLKNKMTNFLILAVSHSKWKIQLETDASGYAIGGVLLQLQKDNSWRSIAYLSKAMNKTERNYKIYNWELLVIMERLK